jgi:hypothetical protein
LELREGTVAVETNSGEVNTKFATSVILHGVDGIPALCRVAAIGPEVAVLNDKGRVEIHGAGAPILVPPGKYVVLQAGKPQGGLETAGKVIAAIPAEVVERQGAAALPLKLNDPVYWQDSVKTEMNGRVRIELTGGSVLNIGVRSQMRIVKHDAATEQTILELGVGKFRGQVVKLTKPGASFKITTQTAVVGVVGTDIVVVSNPDSTTVYDVDGSVKVCTNNRSVHCCGPTQSGQTTTPCCGTSQAGQPPPPGCGTSQSDQSSQSGTPCCVALLPGQFTTVPANGPPSAAANFSSQTLASELSEIGFQALQSGIGLQGAVSIGSAVLSGVAAGVLGVAVWQLGNASDLLNQANSNLGNALGYLGPGWPSTGCGTLGLGQGPGSSPYIPRTPICP